MSANSEGGDTFLHKSAPTFTEHDNCCILEDWSSAL